MAPLAEAFIRIRPDTSGFRREAEQAIRRESDRLGETAGRAFAGTFSQRVRGASGQLSTVLGDAGSDAGRRFGDGFVRDAAGRLRDAQGRFVAEGGSAGDAFGSAFRSRSIGSVAGSGLLIASAIGLGPAIIPIAAAAAAAIAAIGPTAASAFSALGVGVLAFQGIGDAVSALDGAQKDAAKSAASLSGAQNAVASAADGVRSAEAALGNTRAQVAEQNRQAAQRVTDAQRELTQAELDARDIVRELDEARQTASRRLADLTANVKENGLAQRQANLDIAEAKRELDRVLADPKATADQREQARITYERQVLQQEDLKRRGKELAEDQRKATKAGVEGSKEVLAVRERQAAADDRVAQSRRRLADAEREQRNQQRQGAFQLAQATQAVTSAQRALRQATTQAGVAGGAALDKLNEAMAALSPTGQRFAKFIFGLKDEFRSLRDAAADGLLPGAQRGIERLLPYLPQVRGFISEIAVKLGEMADRSARALTSPYWRDFFSLLRSEGVPSLERLFRMAGNVAVGFAGIVRAFAPLNDDVGDGLVRLTERFATWSRQLETSQGFQRFLAYVRDNGPQVVATVGELAQALFAILEASAPIGSVSLVAIKGLATAINAIPTPVLTVLLTVIGSLIVAQKLWTVAMAAHIAITRLFGTTTTTAAAATDRFSTSLGGVNAATGKARTGLGGLSALLAGPWGAAVAAAAVGIGVLSNASADHKSKVQGLTVALRGLGDAFKTVTGAGKDSAEATEEALRSIVANNPDLQKAIIALDGLGIGFDQVARAAGGSTADMAAVIGALDTEIDQIGDKWRTAFFTDPAEAKGLSNRMQELRRFKQAIQDNAGALATQAQALKIADGAQDGYNNTLRFGNHVAPITIETQRQLAEQYQSNAQRITVLQGLVDAFGNSQATAASKADALRAAINQQTGSAVSAIEAQETWRRNLLSLSEAVNANGSSLSLNTQAGLRNRDALQAAAGAVREMYLADIAAGKPIADVTKAHDGRIAALKEEAKRLGLDKTETEKLIKAYGDVPKSVKTAYETKGFQQVFDELQKLQFAQFALKQGWSPAEALNAWKRANTPAPRAFATGGQAHRRVRGYVRGPGTTTSDSIPALLSDEEFVEPANSVRYYGVGLFEALRHRQIPREALPGFARGGHVTWPYPANVNHTKVMSMEEALAKVQPVVSAGGIGSQNMMKLLRRVFPGLPLISGYRPGSRTLSGHLSYHARRAANGQEGRAVDVAPIRAVAEHIFRRYKAPTRELITPFQEFNLHNGRPHRYTGAVWNQHNFAGGNAHVHWALAQGGLISKAMAKMPPVRLFDTGGAWPSGTFGYNGSGRTEYVDPNYGNRRGGDVHLHVHNHGVLGSQYEVDTWLVKSVDRLRRERRLPSGTP